MRLKQYINEVWMKMGYNKYEILENPSMRDLKDLGNEVKFIAYRPNKTLYVWDVYGPLHDDVWLYVNKGYDLEDIINDGDLLAGYAKKKGMRKPVMTGEDGNEFFTDYVERVGMSKKRLLKDWNWLNSYIEINKFLDGPLKKYLK